MTEALGPVYLLLRSSLRTLSIPHVGAGFGSPLRVSGIYYIHGPSFFGPEGESVTDIDYPLHYYLLHGLVLYFALSLITCGCLFVYVYSTGRLSSPNVDVAYIHFTDNPSTPIKHWFLAGSITE